MPRVGDKTTLHIINDAKMAREKVKQCGEKSKVLSLIDLYMFRGCTLYIICDKGFPVSFHTCYFGKKKKNVWEPYTTWYTAYTLIDERRKGYATRLALYARKEAIKRGCVRLKSRIGSIAGLMLHLSLGDEIWGVTDNQEVIVDTPLIQNAAYNGRTPPNAVKGAGTSPWTFDQTMKAIPSGKLPYDEGH